VSKHEESPLGRPFGFGEKVKTLTASEDNYEDEFEVEN
jgi:hypothetical protein